MVTPERRRGMLWSVIEGCTWSVWFGAVSGTFLTGMGLHLGAGGITMGILGALPSVSTTLQLVSAPFVRGLGARRNLLAALCAAQRFTAAVAGLLSLWLIPAPAKLPVFVALQVVAWSAMAPYKVVWQGYMTDLVPQPLRGRYFAGRNAWSTLVALSAGLLYGHILDLWPGIPGFTALYIAAFAAAAMNVGAWFFMPELPQGEVASAYPTARLVWRAMTAPGPHRNAAYFFALWSAGVGLAFPFFPLSLLKDLGLPYSTIALLSTLAALAGMLSATWWGRLQDNIGDSRTIGILLVMLSIVPLLYLSAPVLGWAGLVAAHLCQGSALSALVFASQNLNMRLAPREDRSAYLAFYASAGGLPGLLAPLLAGRLTEHFLPALFLTSGVVLAALAALWNFKVRHTLEQGGFPWQANT